MQLPRIGLLFGVLCTTANALPAPPECNNSTIFHTYDGAAVWFLRDLNATLSETSLNSTRLNATLTKFSHIDPNDAKTFKALDPGNRICGTQDVTLLEAMQRKQSAELEEDVSKLLFKQFDDFESRTSDWFTSTNTSAGEKLITAFQSLNSTLHEDPPSEIRGVVAQAKLVVDYADEDVISMSMSQFFQMLQLLTDMYDDSDFEESESNNETVTLTARDLPPANGSTISETEVMLASLRAYKAALSESPPNATHIYQALMEMMSLAFTAGEDDASVDPNLEAKQLAQVKELTHDIVILENNLDLDDQTSALIPRGTDWRKHVLAWLDQSYNALNPVIDRLKLFKELKALAHHNMEDDDPRTTGYNNQLNNKLDLIDLRLEHFNGTICQDTPIGTKSRDLSTVEFTEAYLAFLTDVNDVLSKNLSDKCHFLADWAEFHWHADKFPGLNLATSSEKSRMANLEKEIQHYLENANPLTIRDSSHVARSDKSLTEVELKFYEQTKKALLKTPVDKKGYFNARTKLAQALTAVNHGLPFDDAIAFDQVDKVIDLQDEVVSLVENICPNDSIPDMEIDMTFSEMCTAYLQEVKASLSESPVNLCRFLAADHQYIRWDYDTYPRASKHDLDTHEIKTLVKDIRKLLKKTKVVAARDSTTATGINLIDPEDTSEADESSQHNAGRDGELSDQNKTALDVLNEALTSTEVITVTATLSNEQ